MAKLRGKKKRTVWNPLRETAPLVLCITNFVTANDCANLLLAAGASPVMTAEPGDAGNLAEKADAVLLNTGTPSGESVRAMFEAGKVANLRGIPLVLDPVGAGATVFRQSLCRKLLENLHFSAVRGNFSEIGYLAGENYDGRGVDSCRAASVSPARESSIGKFARQHRCIASVSGETDFITDGIRSARFHCGHPLMAHITGSGCMSGALSAAMLAALPDEPWQAVQTAVLAMGIAGEKAFARMLPEEGTATFRNRLIDAVSLLTEADFEEYFHAEKNG